jgi:hypothetical protein
MKIYINKVRNGNKYITRCEPPKGRGTSSKGNEQPEQQRYQEVRQDLPPIRNIGSDPNQLEREAVNLGRQDTQGEDLMEKILIESKERTEQMLAPGGGTATEKEIQDVITAILRKKKMDQTEKNRMGVRLSIAHLAQEGATSPKFAETREIGIYTGISIRAGDVREAAKNCNTTIRKLARALRKEAIKVAQTHDIEGNLAKRYKLENPDYQKQELYWVSDFQTFSEEPEMPEKVKEWLLINYNNRFVKE